MPRLKNFVPSFLSEQEYQQYEEYGLKTVEKILSLKFNEKQFPNISENVNLKFLKFRILKI